MRNLKNKIKKYNSLYSVIKIPFRIFAVISQLFEQSIFNIYRLFFRTRVFDCSIFHNEIDLLKLRLEYLKDVVDIFVIVEAKLTFTAKTKKEYNAEKLINQLPIELRKKIRYIQINPLHFPSTIKNDPWKMEEFVRNGISYGLYDLKPFDFLWISDIDEIPNKNNIYKIGALSMHFSNYKMNLLKSVEWAWAKAVLGKDLLKSTPQKIRINAWRFGINVKDSGWHFSWLMEIPEIIYKIKSFSHQECNTKEITDPIYIENCIKNGYDLFNGPGCYKKDDLSFLPEIVKDNLKKYEKYIAK